jgi:integrase
MTRSAGPHKDELTGTWAFVCDLGPGPNGKRRQARRRGFKTKREAQEALDRLRVSARDGTFVEPSKITLAAWLERWCDGLATLGRAPGTIESYRRQMLTHVVPALGGVRIVNLSAADLDALYSRLLATGRRDARGGLSPRTVRYVHTIVSKALSDAVRKRLLVRNPALDADPPSAKSAAPPEMTWWEPDELRAFLTSVASDELGALWRLAAMTGMRRGEVCGLRWSDVDLEAGRLSVRQQLTTVRHELVFRERPKSDHGRRTIGLDAETLAVLRDHRRAQLERRLAVGEEWDQRDLVFCGPAGEPLDPESIAQRFEHRVKAAGVKRLRFHDLRHTHAAHLIAAGQDALVISKRLGHASVSFTYDKYGHLMPKADTDAAAAVAALVDGRS